MPTAKIMPLNQGGVGTVNCGLQKRQIQISERQLTNALPMSAPASHASATTFLNGRSEGVLLQPCHATSRAMAGKHVQCGTIAFFLVYFPGHRKNRKSKGPLPLYLFFFDCHYLFPEQPKKSPELYS